MRVLAVPVKSLERSKSRLSSVLSLPERAALTLAMQEDVLDACLAQAGWETWVVSSDEAVLEVAARRGASTVAEEGGSLRDAVRQVEGSIRGRRSELAVVLGDLPWLTSEALSEALSKPAPVVAAPARSDGGTNLLLRRPPSIIPARFGRASFAKHRWAARRARVPFEGAAGDALGFDLDRPGDLTTLLAGGRGNRALRACLEMGLPARLHMLAGEAGEAGEAGG